MVLGRSSQTRISNGFSAPTRVGLNARQEQGIRSTGHLDPWLPADVYDAGKLDRHGSGFSLHTAAGRGVQRDADQCSLFRGGASPSGVRHASEGFHCPAGF